MELIENKQSDYQATLDAWNPYYDNKLTITDAEEISKNVFKLAELLLSWREKEKQKKAS